MNMKKIILAMGFCALCAVTGWNVLPAQGQETAARPVKAPVASPKIEKIADFDDWSMECVKVAQQETCSLLQQRVAKLDKGPMLVLVGRISLVKQKDKTLPHLRLVTPVGVWLPAGVAFKFDEGKQKTAPFLMCAQDGCMTDLTISEEFLPTVKKSNKLLVAYKRGDQPQTTVELSMKGFTAGLAALTKRGVLNE